MPRDRVTAVAYHEIGHVVLMFATGFKVSEISIEGTADRHGAVAWNGNMPEPTPIQRMKRALVNVAGLVADTIHLERSGYPDEIPEGYTSDLNNVDEDLRFIGHDGNIKAYMGFTMRFLMRPEVWSVVEESVRIILAAGAINHHCALSQIEDAIPKIDEIELESFSRSLERDH